MRSIRWGVFALVAFACVAQAGINNWSARGPFGGTVTDLIIDPVNPAIAYASARYALYKSADGGSTWTELTQDFGRTSIGNLALDPANPGRLYVVSSGGGVFRSTDGGTSFTRISAAPTDANVDGPVGFGISADGNTLYYPTLSGRFFRSTDGGATFSERQPTPSTVEKLVVDPDNSAIIYAAFGPKLLKSATGGDSWTEVPLPASNVFATSVVLTPGIPKTLWLSTGNDVFSTQDDGQTWIPASASLGTRVLHADASSPGVLYASLRDRGGDIWRHSAGTWQVLPTGVPVVVNVLKVSANNSQTILAATTSGIFRTTNGGGAWVRSDNGFNGDSVRVLTASVGHLYAGTDHGEMGVATDDSTLQRTVVSSGLTTTPDHMQLSAIATHPTDSNILIAGFNAGGYKLSSDGGATWTPGSAYLNTAWMDAIAVDPSNPLLVYAAVRPSTGGPLDPIQHSTDGGMTFSPLVTSLANIDAKRLIVDPHESSRLFLASQTFGGTDGLFRSDDSGATWANLRNNTTIFDVAIDPADSKRIYAVTGSQVLISDDGGDTFTAASALSQGSQGNPFSLALDPVLTNVVYVLSAQNTPNPPLSEYFIMRSVDRGVSWERVPNSSLPNWAPWKLAINSAIPTVLFAATDGRGVQSFEIAPDLAISIVGHSGTRPLSVQSFFDVKAQNAGPLAATSLQLNIAVPAGTQNVSATIPNGSCTVGAASVQCSLPYLKLNEMASARVNYTPTAGGPLDVQATVSARERDPVTTNNTAAATATAIETVDLAVSGSASASSVERGAAFTYTFQIRNAGPNASSATHLTIAAASGVTVASASPAGCTVSSNTINCDLGALASAATVSVTVNATATVAGTLQTTATASHAATAIDVDASNDIATVNVVSTEPQGPGSGSNGGGGGGGGRVSTDLLIGLALLVLGSALRRYRTTHIDGGLLLMKSMKARSGAGSRRRPG
jgi:photosystem II stability/assembly factor-like uncharacterized protein